MESFQWTRGKSHIPPMNNPILSPMYSMVLCVCVGGRGLYGPEFSGPGRARPGPKGILKFWLESGLARSKILNFGPSPAQSIFSS